MKKRDKYKDKLVQISEEDKIKFWASIGIPGYVFRMYCCLMLSSGDIEKNVEEANNWLIKAYNIKYPHAILEVGLIALLGLHDRYNQKNGLEILETLLCFYNNLSRYGVGLAEAEYDTIFSFISNCHLYGIGTNKKKNICENITISNAFKYFEKPNIVSKEQIDKIMKNLRERRINEKIGLGYYINI